MGDCLRLPPPKHCPARAWISLHAKSAVANPSGSRNDAGRARPEPRGFHWTPHPSAGVSSGARATGCVASDGGGALLVVAPEIAAQIKRPAVRVLGAGEAIKPLRDAEVDLTHSAGLWSAAKAFEEAGVRPANIQYASLYDSFTITVLVQIEDLGFCAKGEGGRFVADGNLQRSLMPTSRRWPSTSR